MRDKGKNIKAKKRRLWAELSAAGIQFPVSIAIGYYIGKYIDKFFNTYPIFTVIFSIFGVIAAFVNIFRLNAELNKLENEEKGKNEG